MSRPGDPHHIPDAWPALLSIEQLCAYVGLGETTLKRVYPYAPRDLGANVLRYAKAEADLWVGSLPPRLPKAKGGAQDEARPEPEPLFEAPPADRAAAAIDAVRARAQGRVRGGAAECRKVATAR